MNCKYEYVPYDKDTNPEGPHIGLKAGYDGIITKVEVSGFTDVIRHSERDYHNLFFMLGFSIEPVCVKEVGFSRVPSTLEDFADAHIKHLSRMFPTDELTQLREFEKELAKIGHMGYYRSRNFRTVPDGTVSEQ